MAWIITVNIIADFYALFSVTVDEDSCLDRSAEPSKPRPNNRALASVFSWNKTWRQQYPLGHSKQFYQCWNDLLTVDKCFIVWNNKITYHIFHSDPDKRIDKLIFDKIIWCKVLKQIFTPHFRRIIISERVLLKTDFNFTDIDITKLKIRIQQKQCSDGLSDKISQKFRQSVKNQ